MRKACESYISLCQASDRVAAVAALSDAELVAVRGLLGRIYDENEVSGELLGICLVEEGERFERMVKKEERP